MTCPKCRSYNLRVLDNRNYVNDEIRRRRECTDCGHIFATIEIHADRHKQLRNAENTLRTLAKMAEGVLENE